MVGEPGGVDGHDKVSSKFEIIELKKKKKKKEVGVLFQQSLMMRSRRTQATQTCSVDRERIQTPVPRCRSGAHSMSKCCTWNPTIK